MIEYESAFSVHEYCEEMLDDIFGFLQEKLEGNSAV
jgi:hypothetical protein